MDPRFWKYFEVLQRFLSALMRTQGDFEQSVPKLFHYLHYIVNKTIVSLLLS